MSKPRKKIDVVTTSDHMNTKTYMLLDWLAESQSHFLSYMIFINSQLYDFYQLTYKDVYNCDLITIHPLSQNN